MARLSQPALRNVLYTLRGDAPPHRAGVRCTYPRVRPGSSLYGGANGIRTHDLLLARQTLYL